MKQVLHFERKRVCKLGFCQNQKLPALPQGPRFLAKKDQLIGLLRGLPSYWHNIACFLFSFFEKEDEEEDKRKKRKKKKEEEEKVGGEEEEEKEEEEKEEREEEEEEKEGEEDEKEKRGQKQRGRRM